MAGGCRGRGWIFCGFSPAGSRIIRFIAEDLGQLTPEVHALRDAAGLPGMKVLEFAFDPEGAGDYLPT